MSTYTEDPPILLANERAVVARFAMHLANCVEPQLTGIHVDVEYSRVGQQRNPKRRAAGSRIYPDVIVHKRTRPNPNLLAAEFKLARRLRVADRMAPDRDDEARVEELVRTGPASDDTRPYWLGLCVTLYDDHATLWWFELGNPRSEEEVRV